MRTTRARYRAMLAVVGAITLAVLSSAVALWPRGELPKPAAGGQADSTRLVAATLTTVARVDCPEADPGVPGSVCIKVKARLAGGRQVSFDTTDPTGGMFRAGQRVRLAVTEQPGGQPLYYIQDLERGRPLLVLAALFAGAVVAFGRWQGVRSLLGLGLSFVVIVSFVVPAILHGHSPVLVAVTGAMAIMLISLYLSHGTGPKTTAAVVGTALALGLTAALAIAFVAAASLTGLASEEALSANYAVGGLSLRGLLLAGIIIGGLGVLDDVTMSQASLVAELHQANPTAGFAALVGGALRVGRDHIAATVNTLFLAYAGAALPSLILFVTGQDSLSTVVTTEIVAVEVVRALCGSVGLIAAVPLTTVLAALVATEEAPDFQLHASGDRDHQPRTTAASAEATVTASQGRTGWGLARGLGREEAGLVLDRVLAVHGPHLSHAMVDVDSGSWLTAEELPAAARTAAGRLRQLAADAQRGRPGTSGPAPAAWSASTSATPRSWTCCAATVPSPPTPGCGSMATPSRSSRSPTASATCPTLPIASTRQSSTVCRPSLPRPAWSARHWYPADCAPPRATKEYGSSWIFERCLTWANVLQRVQRSAFSLVNS